MLFRSKEGISFEPWPTYDEKFLIEEEVELVIQVNGKIRSKLVVPFNAKQEDIQDKAFELIQTQLEGKTIRKVIYVPNKLLNVVVG